MKLSACGLALVAVIAAQLPSLAADTVPVTGDNFVRAESDVYFGGITKDFGFGKIGYNREPAPIENQTVIRLNRDTLYGGGVFDLDAGPVTVTLPDAGKRFMSFQRAAASGDDSITAFNPGVSKAWGEA